MDIFSTRLKELREENGLTQSDLVNLLKNSHNITTSSQNISYWEKGREPNYETLSALAKSFNVSIDYLLGNSHLKNKKDETTLKELELIINTNDKLLALHTVLTNIKCFSSLFEYGAKISHSETIFLCRVILDNIISTINVFQEKNDKFSSLHFLLKSEEESDLETQKLLNEINKDIPILKNKHFLKIETINQAKINLGTLIKFRNENSSLSSNNIEIINSQISELKNIISELEKKG